MAFQTLKHPHLFEQTLISAEFNVSGDGFKAPAGKKIWGKLKKVLYLPDHYVFG